MKADELTLEDFEKIIEEGEIVGDELLNIKKWIFYAKHHHHDPVLSIQHWRKASVAVMNTIFFLE